jgi:hypothetical protein
MTNDIPWQDVTQLATARLLLGPRMPRDAGDVFAYAADPDVARYTFNVEELWVFLDTEFAKLTQDMGDVGMSVHYPNEMQGTIDEAMASDKPAVVDVVSDINGIAPRAWTPVSGLYASRFALGSGQNNCGHTCNIRGIPHLYRDSVSHSISGKSALE